MFIIKKGAKSRYEYLGFDSRGKHEWKGDRLDAIRFDNEKDVHQCCNNYISTGAIVARVDEWDGHYEEYQGFEVQIFRDNVRNIPGGKRWRFRIGEIAHDRPYEYTPGTRGYADPEKALLVAKNVIAARIAEKIKV